MYGLEGIAQGNGIMLMVVGMVVVFAALVILMFLMKALKRYQEWVHYRKQCKQRAQSECADGDEDMLGGDVPGTVVAAIAITILLEEEQVHDEESLVLTLQHLPKPYSNWWQSRVNPDWPAKITRGRPTVMQTEDPERGRIV